MFFDIGWSELLVIGVVALVFIGPKDLPRALRVAGYWFRKARSLSREFQNSVDQMIREAELDEVREQLKKATEFDINKEFQKTVDPSGELARSINPHDIPDYFETAPTTTPAATSKAAPPADASATLTAGEPAATATEPQQASLPFDSTTPVPAPSPEKIAVPRDPEPPKP